MYFEIFESRFIFVDTPILLLPLELRTEFLYRSERGSVQKVIFSIIEYMFDLVIRQGMNFVSCVQMSLLNKLRYKQEHTIRKV